MEYTPLNQEESFGHFIEKAQYELPRKPTNHLSPFTTNLILGLALVVTMACLAFTTLEVAHTVQLLQPHLEFTETHGLARPDQYNGKEHLFAPLVD
jgi:hypothetical protein